MSDTTATILAIVGMSMLSFLANFAMAMWLARKR